MVVEMRCQCGVACARGVGETHRYIPATAECWALFNEVLARDYSDMTLYNAVHQLTVDSYAAQHVVGHPAKSLTGHLVSLHAVFVLDKTQEEARGLLKLYVDGRKHFPDLIKPDYLGSLTIADIIAVEDKETHIQRVQEWARQVWNAWSPQHDMIAALVAGEA